MLFTDREVISTYDEICKEFKNISFIRQKYRFLCKALYVINVKKLSNIHFREGMKAKKRVTKLVLAVILVFTGRNL